MSWLSKFPRRLIIVVAACGALWLSAGCLPHGVWLPDSSGYVYTAGKDSQQVLLYDVGKRHSRVLVKNITNGTAVPAVSPDGKQIAVAQLTGSIGKEHHLQIILFDLAGKEVHRSRNFPWEGPGTPSEIGSWIPALYWAPEGDKLLVCPGPDTAIYDLKKNTVTKRRGWPMIIGNALSRPDGKRFILTFPDTISVVDWSGEGKEIQNKHFGVRLDDPELGMLLYPQAYSTRWEGDTAIIRWSKVQLRIDTKKVEATPEEVKIEQTADMKTIRQTFSFGEEAPSVRVVELIAPKLEKRGLDDKDEDPPERIWGQWCQFRIELVKPGVATPKVLIDKHYGPVQLLPAPDRKLLAIECGGKRLILLVDSRGEVVAKIDALKTQ